MVRLEEGVGSTRSGQGSGHVLSCSGLFRLVVVVVDIGPPRDTVPSHRTAARFFQVINLQLRVFLGPSASQRNQARRTGDASQLSLSLSLLLRFVSHSGHSPPAPPARIMFLRFFGAMAPVEGAR